jgi:uncharacterized phage-associated protein
MSLALTHRKATQALNFMARQSGGRINRLKALKLIFFADRYHLRKYGRTVSECAYYAMTHGPVASEAKNIAEDNDRLSPTERTYGRRFLRKRDFDYASVVDIDKSVLSATDLEALDFAWKNFGSFSKYQLRDITHHYPEWKRHERALGHPTKRRVPMDCADFFEEPDAGYIPCHALTEEERKAARELFLQRQAFDKHWS